MERREREGNGRIVGHLTGGKTLNLVSARLSSDLVSVSEQIVHHVYMSSAGCPIHGQRACSGAPFAEPDDSAQLPLARHFVEIGERRPAESGGVEPANHLTVHKYVCCVLEYVSFETTSAGMPASLQTKPGRCFSTIRRGLVRNGR